MANTIEYERIAKLINNKTVTVLDTQYCQEFNKFISTEYPWDEGYKDVLDWYNIPGYKQVKNVQLFSLEAKQFIYNTRAAKHEYLAIIYGGEKPGVVGKIDNIVNNLSELSFHTPWTEFLVGAKKISMVFLN